MIQSETLLSDYKNMEKGLSLRNLGLSILLFSIHVDAQGAALNPFAPCQQGMTGNFPFPGQRMLYVVCTSPTAGAMRACPGDELFNPSSRQCEVMRAPPPASGPPVAGTQPRNMQNTGAGGNGMNDVMSILARLAPTVRMMVQDTLDAEMRATRGMAQGTQQRTPGGGGGRGRRRRPFSKVQNFLGSSRVIKGRATIALTNQLALTLLRDELGLSADELLELIETLPPLLRPNQTPASPDAPEPPLSADTCPQPRNDEVNKCDKFTTYRTLDGSCNNLEKPLWGKSLRPLRRLINPDFADGIGMPRVSSNGGPLPSARSIVIDLFGEKDAPSHLSTMLHMRMGQFLDHDLDRTAISKLATSMDGSTEPVNIECGDDGCSTYGPENRNCFPILIPANDPDFTDRQCLMFVRSEEAVADDCRLSARQQVNQITSWIDSSNVYGSDREYANTLRDQSMPDRGRLNMTEHPYDNMLKLLLPPGNDPDCADLNDTIRCFTAGDTRVNEHVALSSMHTVFSREHNRIEEELHRLNPHWSGERLYQETRKILNSAWQFMVYNEYLPTVLGPQMMKKYGLNLLKAGYFEGYDPTVNPDISNSFATAAFRFGHSQIANFMKFTDSLFKNNVFLHDSLFNTRPAAAYDTNLPGGSGIDAMFLGHATQASETVDRSFTKRITTQLFSDNPPTSLGTDLPSLNIQRGRDHGIPSYVRWREYCDLSVPTSFDDMEDIPEDARNIIAGLYESVEDIDVFAAAMAERSLSGSLLGPTFACIIAGQFRAAKVGDRFWHERQDGVVGFRADQLQEIRKWSLSRVLCENLDFIRNIQRWPLLQPFTEAIRGITKHDYQELYSLVTIYQGDYNYMRQCEQIPKPDLSRWRDFQR